MKLIASMNVHNEMSRYLPLVIDHLSNYCDEIRCQDDGSEDGSYEYLQDHPSVQVQRNPGPTWSENEGELHQNLLDWTLEAEPTHILAIDSDEIVPEGLKLRHELERTGQASRSFMLNMIEVWGTGLDDWTVRMDGGWVPHPVSICYQLPPQLSKKARKKAQGEWRIWGRKMAGGRVPRIVRTDHHQGLAMLLPIDIYHLGWSRPEGREARHRRYVEVDGGNFHASAHLDSIMWADDHPDIILEPIPVPVADPWREIIAGVEVNA